MEFHGLKRHLYQIWVIRIRMLDFLDLMGVIERKLALRMLLILLIVFPTDTQHSAVGSPRKFDVVWV